MKPLRPILRRVALAVLTAAAASTATAAPLDDLRRLVEGLARVGLGGTERDAEEAQLGQSGRETVIDERQFVRPSTFGHLEKLQTIADGPHGAYQIVAEPCADQRAEIG